MRRAALVAPLAVLLIAGGCKETPDALGTVAGEASVCANVPQMPMRGRVTDAANILTDEEEALLTTRLARYEAQTKHQMAVATTPDLNGVSIDNFGRCLGNRWEIGRKGHNDGLLILVAPNEKHVRVVTGTGMEKLLTDAEAGAIIKRMTPYYKVADYARGLSTGIEAIAAQTGDTP